MLPAAEIRSEERSLAAIAADSLAADPAPLINLKEAEETTEGDCSGWGLCTVKFCNKLVRVLTPATNLSNSARETGAELMQADTKAVDVVWTAEPTCP